MSRLNPRVTLILVLLGLASVASAQTLAPLHTDGRRIVDDNGDTVPLRGLNVGGWLVTEAWMCGQTDAGERNARQQLEKRFGAARASALMNVWEQNWISTADLDVIQKYGCNLLRVPFSYRTLQDAKGNWIRDSTGNIDFSRMDWIVRAAQQRRMYVIFDLHVWPGEYHVISRLTPEGDQARTGMAALWTQVARHYRGAPQIAGFDVINEPEGSPGNTLQWAFYKAIRAEDPGRMVIFESVDYGSIAGAGWTNIVYSAHYPEDSLKTGSVRDRLEEFNRKAGLTAHPQVQVPIYIGETKAPADNADSAYELGHAYNELGWSWSVWTYKGVDNGGWASMNYDASIKYDLSKNSLESILRKWSGGLTAWRRQAAPRLNPNDWWIAGFGKGFREGLNGT